MASSYDFYIKFSVEEGENVLKFLHVIGCLLTPRKPEEGHSKVILKSEMVPHTNRLLK